MQKYAGRFGSHKYSLRRKHVLVFMLLQEIVLERQKNTHNPEQQQARAKKTSAVCPYGFMQTQQKFTLSFYHAATLGSSYQFQACINLPRWQLSQVLISDEHRVLLYQHKQKHLITSVGPGSFKLLKKAVLGTEMMLWEAQSLIHHFIQATHRSDLIQGKETAGYGHPSSELLS